MQSPYRPLPGKCHWYLTIVAEGDLKWADFVTVKLKAETIQRLNCYVELLIVFKDELLL